MVELWFALSRACDAIGKRRTDRARVILRKSGLVPRSLNGRGRHGPIQLLEHAVVSLRAIAGPKVLHFADDGSRFQLNSVSVDLGSRPTLRRIFAALVEAAGPLTTENLLRHGWPDELVTWNAGQCRVRSAIASLRRAGLGDDIVHERAIGYALSERIEVRVVPRSALDPPSERESKLPIRAKLLNRFHAYSRS
jgi:hypothetical protein